MFWSEIIRYVFLTIGRIYIIISCIVGTYILISWIIMIWDIGFEDFLNTCLRAGKDYDEIKQKHENESKK